MALSGLVVARTGLCRRPCCALCRAPCRRPPVTIQKLYRTKTPVARTARRAERIAALLRLIAGRRVPCRSPCRDTRAAPPPRYKILYRDTLQWPGNARALPLAPRAGRPCRGSLLAVSWLAAGRVVARCWSCRAWSCSPLPSCVTIQSIVL